MALFFLVWFFFSEREGGREGERTLCCSSDRMRLKPSRNQKQTTVILDRAKQQLFKKTGKRPTRYLLIQGRNFFCLCYNCVEVLTDAEEHFCLVLLPCCLFFFVYTAQGNFCLWWTCARSCRKSHRGKRGIFFWLWFSDLTDTEEAWLWLFFLSHCIRLSRKSSFTENVVSRQASDDGLRCTVAGACVWRTKLAVAWCFFREERLMVHAEDVVKWTDCWAAECGVCELQ